MGYVGSKPANSPVTADQLGFDTATQAELDVVEAAKVSKTGDESVDGVKTFSSFPITPSSAPTTDYQVANKKYVDNSGGAVGGGTDKIFVENGQVVTTSYTITSGNNAMTAGDITINTGVTVTVPSGSRWVIV